MGFNFQTGDQTVAFSGYGELKITSKKSSAVKGENVLETPIKNSRGPMEYEEACDESEFVYDDFTPEKERVTDVIKALRKLEENVRFLFN